jgi:hypothetical protein
LEFSLPIAERRLVGFNPCTYKVRTRLQPFACKCDLCRYTSYYCAAHLPCSLSSLNAVERATCCVETLQESLEKDIPAGIYVLQLASMVGLHSLPGGVSLVLHGTPYRLSSIDALTAK